MTFITSPGGNPLTVLDGNADDLDRRGRQLERLGQQMDATATSLERISDGVTQISDAVDKLRESAGEVHEDLSKAAVRYEKTGEVLRAYAAALETARQNVDPLVDDIEQAVRNAAAAREEVDAAQGTIDDQNTTWLWEEEATDRERADARDTLSDARSALSSAEDALEDLWSRYDRHFEAWSSAYDDAVAGIEHALDIAGNDDSWFDDALDEFMTALGWLLVAITVVAMLFPVTAAVLLAIAAVLTVVSLLANIYRVSRGRATWIDVGLDVVGLIPFVKPAAAAIGASGGFVRTFTASLGPAAMQSALGLTRDKLTHYMTQGVAQSARGPVLSQIDDLMRPVSGNVVQRGLQNVWNTILGGNTLTANALGLQQNALSAMNGAADLRRAMTQSGLADLVPSVANQVHNGINALLALDTPAQQVVPGYGEFRDEFLAPAAS
ncbi:hypothetical protein CLV46_2844 [Diaminobutyricimonas aerilata]|uniref:Uncharacterized protein n=1 Tax=Diaminobutyricimonas aerilata TaxID=1162967 RepID=A0A2M9CN08_9MICO|nr:hypothetical protein [Diaminobutyricimonas aerilata]PJJ73258.1 hypothetical protein CLV46_2844 [Diaminobutyricimonas aerilata]